MNDVPLALVTGGGSGIGRAVALTLAKRGVRVLINGRRTAPLEAVAAEHASIHPIAGDITDEADRKRISTAVADHGRLNYLLHNAGMLAPIGRLDMVDENAWEQALRINLIAPFLLTRALMAGMAEDARVLHVSSGAAHKAYEGWGAYCVSKAGLNMLYRVWREEWSDKPLHIGSVRPGVVDTPMQALIREQNDTDFPAVSRFKKLHAKGELDDPARVARFIAWLLLDVDAETFSGHEWDIRDEEDLAAWLQSAGQ